MCQGGTRDASLGIQDSRGGMRDSKCGFEQEGTELRPCNYPHRSRPSLPNLTLNIAVSIRPSHHEIAQLSPPLHPLLPEFCLYRTMPLQPSWVPTAPWPSPDIHPPYLAFIRGLETPIRKRLGSVPELAQRNRCG